MNGFFVADLGLEIRRLREALPDRRERIATAALQGLLAAPYAGNDYEYLSRQAVEAADALICELDKKEDKP